MTVQTTGSTQTAAKASVVLPVNLKRLRTSFNYVIPTLIVSPILLNNDAATTNAALNAPPQSTTQHQRGLYLLSYPSSQQVLLLTSTQLDLTKLLLTLIWPQLWPQLLLQPLPLLKQLPQLPRQPLLPNLAEAISASKWWIVQMGSTAATACARYSQTKNAKMISVVDQTWTNAAWRWKWKLEVPSKESLRLSVWRKVLSLKWKLLLR